MAICSDGLYRMDPAWQYPGTNYYPGIEGLDTYVKQDQAKARALLQKAGYKGEEIEIVTDNSFRNHLDTGTVAAGQLKAVGMNVKLSVMDWPTVMSRRTRAEGWNMWPLGMGIEPYEGPYNVVGFFSGGNPVQMKADPVIDEAQKTLTSDLSMQGRVDAVKKFQARLYDQAIAVKVGDLGIVQATRANVVNYAPYRIPRMWDCWFA
jgi:peptide/nickel transport system substrate-binding protein